MGSRPPAPPDPAETAGAQTAQNVSTAIAQGYMNNVNQVTPYGNLTYEVSGQHSMTDPNTGNVYDVPTWTARQEYNPTQTATIDSQQEAGLNLANIGRDQSGRIGDLLGTPLEMSNEAVESRLMELGRARLDPALDRRREAEQNRMVQMGIMPGSEGYDRTNSRLMEGENDAYNQLLLQGRGQAMQELLTERNQPINETSALMSGSQIQAPTFANPNSAQLANVDRAGLEMDAYNANLSAWDRQNANRQGIMGGLFGLAGNLFMSDRRRKRDIRKIGMREGLGVYAFRYDWEPNGTERVGYMAQEVAKVVPSAVVDIGGTLLVDYDQLPEVA